MSKARVAVLHVVSGQLSITVGGQDVTGCRARFYLSLSGCSSATVRAAWQFRRSPVIGARARPIRARSATRSSIAIVGCDGETQLMMP